MSWANCVGIRGPTEQSRDGTAGRLGICPLTRSDPRRAEVIAAPHEHVRRAGSAVHPQNSESVRQELGSRNRPVAGLQCDGSRGRTAVPLWRGSTFNFACLAPHGEPRGSVDSADQRMRFHALVGLPLGVLFSHRGEFVVVEFLDVLHEFNLADGNATRRLVERTRRRN